MTDKTQATGSVVACTMPLEFVTPDGETFTLEADFRYDVTDPFAVTTVFRTGTQEVTWTFGRELLIEGTYSPSGEGDVRVWPCLNTYGEAVTIIELASPDGEVMVQADTRRVVEFCKQMTLRVPMGAESLAYDFDAALASLAD